MNPILQTIGRNQIQQIKPMIEMAKGNPQAMLNRLMQTNPQMRGVMDYINRNGGDPKKAFYTMAQQKGVNPDDILSLLK